MCSVTSWEGMLSWEEQKWLHDDHPACRVEILTDCSLMEDSLEPHEENGHVGYLTLGF